jgi:hypothetical protein
MTKHRDDDRRAAPALRIGASALAVAAVCLPIRDALSQGDGGNTPVQTAATTLEETRMRMGKWIETQQILSKERNEWQQGREVLAGRVELLRKEVTTLQERIATAEASLAASNAKRDALLATDAELQGISAQMAAAVALLEADVRRLARSLPEPLAAKLQPLYQRIPDDPTQTKVSVAERFQSVLGIVNAANQAHTELDVQYEVRTLAGGAPTEVRVLYVGLAQAYYVSASGEAGIGHPTPDGWTWESSKAISADVLTSLDILAGKHSPAFVPLPVTIR